MRALEKIWARLGPPVLARALPVRPRTDLVKLGNRRADWIVPAGLFDEDAVCYTVGAGEDISFDLELIERFGCRVYGFDPTPRAIAHVKQTAGHISSYHFEPYGLWSSDTDLKFYAPLNPKYVSHSALNLRGTSDYFVAPCKRVSTIMQELGHDRLDLLKIDIEGAEYEVLQDLLDSKLLPGVLCVEFDQPASPWRTLQTIRRVLNAGYDLVAVDAWNYTFVKGPGDDLHTSRAGEPDDELTASLAEPICACPQCEGPLVAGQAGPGRFLACDACMLAFPIIEGILVLLPNKARHAGIEMSTVQTLLDNLGKAGEQRFEPHLRRTHQILEQQHRPKGWEWEDEVYWAEHYSQAIAADQHTDWGHRLWERAPYVKQLLAGLPEQNTILVDVGAGEGHTFRNLMAPELHSSTTYVAIDISFDGLRLNRLRNPHRRSLYILGTADRVPLLPERADALCYIGILHHAERKSATVTEDFRLLKPGGMILLYEAVDRPGFLTTLGLGAQEPESAHEERIPLRDMLGALRSLPGSTLLVERRFHSMAYSAGLRIRLGPINMSKPWQWEIVRRVDQAVVATLGRFIPFCRAGAIIALARKDTP